MTKNVLLVGCGSKSGLDLTNSFLQAGYTVDLISSTEVDILNTRQCRIDWSKLTVAHVEAFLKDSPVYDSIVFNQNARALATDCYTADRFKTLELWSIERVWNQAYFNNCILPFHIIHTLGSRCASNTNVAWMLSELIYDHQPGVGYADYIGHKYQNYVLMKSFSKKHSSCFVGINRGRIKIVPADVVTLLESKIASGKVFYSDGTEDINFNRMINE